MNGFKDWKISKKLIAAFLIVAVMAAAIGIVGIVGMTNMSNADQTMYDENTEPMGDLATMYDSLASQRICAANMIVFDDEGADPEFAAAELESLAEKEQIFEDAFRDYSDGVSNAEEQALYDNMSQLYFNDFKQLKDDLRAAYKTGDNAAEAEALKAIDDMGSEISGYMDEAVALNETLAQQKVASNQSLATRSTVILIVVMAAGVVLALLFAFIISKMISAPIGRILAATKQAGEEGNFDFPEESVAEIKNDAQFKDETGQMAGAFAVMMDSLIEKTKVLDIVASGDLTPDVPMVSATDTIGNSISKMIGNLNGMFSQINMATEQVSSGANQMAMGAQSLAQATTEQATTVDQLSHTLSGVSEKTKNNAQMAEKAAHLAVTIKENAEQGALQMDQMIDAVNDINESSKNISSVIKVIDDIAFQTNILALNAAVEAARAGEHGKGFAVVADEVRNLAAKSAEAAKNTGEMIEDSVAKAKLGDQIARQTAEALKEIVSGVGESTGIVGDIAKMSEEQSDDITNISDGLDQLTQVVQQNSATAQESAAASQEMSGQSNMLKTLVEKFKLKNMD